MHCLSLHITSRTQFWKRNANKETSRCVILSYDSGATRLNHSNKFSFRFPRRLQPQTLIRNLDQPHFCVSFNKHRLHTTDEINTSLKPCQFFSRTFMMRKDPQLWKVSFCPSTSTKTSSRRCLCSRKKRCEGLFVWIMEILWFIRHSSRSKSSSERDSEEAVW